MENQRLIVRCLPTGTLSMMIEVLRRGIVRHQVEAMSRAIAGACSTMQVTWQSLDTRRGLVTTGIHSMREVVTIITSTSVTERALLF